MITALTQENAHLHGPALASMYRLRQREFIDRQGWDIPTWRGMEYDAYDNPASTYLIYQDDTGTVQGVSRLYPTDRPYMLSDIWPELVQTIKLPSSISVWEGSRFVIDKNLTKEQRTKIKHEIVCAYLEFSLARNIKKIIGVMPPAIWRAVFQSSGWKPTPIGPTITTDEKVKVFAAELPVSDTMLKNVRRTTGLLLPVLKEDTHEQLQQAA